MSHVMTNEQMAGLAEALEYLNAFLDPRDNSRCAVDARVREEAYPYLDTWVRGPLLAVAGTESGRPSMHDRLYLASLARDATKTSLTERLRDAVEVGLRGLRGLT